MIPYPLSNDNIQSDIDILFLTKYMMLFKCFQDIEQEVSEFLKGCIISECISDMASHL